MDFSIVNVALPSIQQAFGASLENLQWVVSGYALTYGGFVLLGARAADLFGRRRVFVLGLSLFSAASLVGGAGQSMGMLITARALQGIGAAMDQLDAYRAARSVLTGEAATDPKRASIEPLRGLNIARRSALKAQQAAWRQIGALLL